MTRPLSEFQRGLQHFNGVLYLPNATDSTGGGLGSPWSTDTAAAGVVVTHPAPASTGIGGWMVPSEGTPGRLADISTALKRTAYANAGGFGLTDQEMGPRLAGASDKQFYFGDAKGLGGWYMSAMFMVTAWAGTGAGTDGRLFVGMSASNNPVCINDVPPANTVGLWHKSTHGQDELYLLTVTNGGAATEDPLFTKVTVTNCSTTGASVTLTTSSSFAGPPAVTAGMFIRGAGITAGTFVISVASTTSLTMSAAMTVAAGTTVTFCTTYLAAGQALLYEMWAFPHGISVVNTNCRLSSLNTGKKQKWFAQGGGPGTAVMLAPQCQMSNAADTTAGHYQLDVANVYCAPYSGENDMW